MKLNKFLLSLLIAPALTLVSCSDYEDTEVASPEAEASAIGAYFSNAVVENAAFVSKPKESASVKLTLNRLNTKDAITVPVIVKSCDEVTPGVKFCDQPTTFTFASGEKTATIELACSPACVFQKTYRLAVAVAAKDHPYVEGSTSVTLSFKVDYVWKQLGKPVILENGWYNGGIIAPVEWASNYEDNTTPGNRLFRVKALYGTANIKADVTLGKGEESEKYTSASPGDLQFLLDEDYEVVGMLSAPPAYEPEKINTGILQNEKTGNYFIMNVQKLELAASKYTFTYNVKAEGSAEKTGVTAVLDFDFKTPVEKLSEK